MRTQVVRKRLNPKKKLKRAENANFNRTSSEIQLFNALERTVDTRCLMCLLSKKSSGCCSLGEKFQHFYSFSKSTNLTIFQLRFTFNRGFTKFRKIECNCSPAAHRIIQIHKKYACNFLPIQWFVLWFLGTWSQSFHGSFEHFVVQHVEKFVFCRFISQYKIFWAKLRISHFYKCAVASIEIWFACGT